MKSHFYEFYEFKQVGQFSIAYIYLIEKGKARPLAGWLAGKTCIKILVFFVKKSIVHFDFSSSKYQFGT